MTHGQAFRLGVEAFGLVTTSGLVDEVGDLSDDKKKGRVTGLITSCVIAVFLNSLLKEVQREGYK
jgi:hypothetical protein